jgi:hypothetical protein
MFQTKCHIMVVDYNVVGREQSVSIMLMTSFVGSNLDFRSEICVNYA